MVGVKYIASVSFGKDSLAMLLRLLEENYPLDAVVFYDTGMEFQCIYKIRDKVKIILEQHGIGFVELKPQELFLYSMIAMPFMIGCGLGGGSWEIIADLITEKLCKKYTVEFWRLPR